MRLLGFVLLLVGIVITLVQLTLIGPQLPEKVASHFGADGQPDGWTSSTVLLILYGVLQFGGAALMIGLAKLIWILPDSLLNIPNKDYWLAEERRSQTLQINTNMLIFIAGLTAMFLAGIFQMIFQANLNNQQALPMALFWVELAVYLVLVIGVVVNLHRRFLNVPAE